MKHNPRYTNDAVAPHHRRGGPKRFEDRRPKCKKKSVEYHAKRLLARFKPKKKKPATRIYLEQMVVNHKPLQYHLSVVVENPDKSWFSPLTGTRMHSKHHHLISQEPIQMGWKLDRALKMLIADGSLVPSMSDKEFRIQVGLGTATTRTFRYKYEKEAEDQACVN